MNQSKPCSQCKRSLDISYFQYRSDRLTYHSWCRDCLNTWHAQYRITTNRRDAQREYKRQWEIRYPEKVKAQQLLRRAVAAGTIVRGSCSKCPSLNRAQAHHPDYNHALLVVWLCPKCHRSEHGKVA